MSPLIGGSTAYAFASHRSIVLPTMAHVNVLCGVWLLRKRFIWSWQVHKLISLSETQLLVQVYRVHFAPQYWHYYSQLLTWPQEGGCCIKYTTCKNGRTKSHTQIVGSHASNRGRVQWLHLVKSLYSIHV